MQWTDDTTLHRRTAGFQSPRCPLWVISRQQTSRRGDEDVRFTPESGHGSARREMSALCHKPTFGVAANYLFDDLDRQFSDQELWKVPRIRSIQTFARNGFSISGTPAAAIRSRSVQFANPVIIIAGIETPRSRSLASSSRPVIPGI